MKYHCEFKCDVHNDQFDCPDRIIYFSQKTNEYGIIIHDGGSSWISIKYCPWCGIQIKFNKDEED
jgi:hypothetical protein